MRFEFNILAMSDRGITPFGPTYEPPMVAAIAGATGAIHHLDARISVSYVAKAWHRRATWSGFARALQLQSVEIDEIDVFSWGCALQVPGRPLRATHGDLFEAHDPWRLALTDKDPLRWRDSQSTRVAEATAAADHPTLVRAIDLVRQHCRLDSSIQPWLALPFILRDLHVTHSPLPCLTGGTKAFRLKNKPNNADWLVALKSVEQSALKEIARLDRLERLYRDTERAVASEFRAGALPRLAALTHHCPLVSPQSVATALGLSVAGASKLLQRATASGLLVEITRRRSWRLFLTRDLAIELGYVSPPLGRPRHEPAPTPPSQALASVFSAFDAEMAAIDALLSRSQKDS